MKKLALALLVAACASLFVTGCSDNTDKNASTPAPSTNAPAGTNAPAAH